jgi:transposase-like protein
MSQRDIAYGPEQALGQLVPSKGAVRDLTETLTPEDAAFRPRELSGYERASLFREAVYEPVRRWGNKTGAFCVGASCVEGRKVLLRRSTANRERSASGLEVRRDLVKRGRQTPVTITTEGAAGLTTAIAALWPTALRMRGGLHKMQHLQPQVPPQAWPGFKTVGADLRAAPPGAEAARRRPLRVNRSQRDFPEAWRCRWDAAEASLSPLSVPQRPQPYVRTATLAERAFEAARRRTQVMPHWWEEGSVVRLGDAVLIRGRDRWGKKCFSALEHHQIRSLRRPRQLDEPTGIAPPASPQPRRSAASAA